MKKIFVLIALLLAVSIFPPKSEASTKLAGSSAALLIQRPQVKMVVSDPRVIALQKFFQKYNSPLEPYAQDFITKADKYGVDWKLLPAITGVESTFGQAYIHGTHNPYGWGSGLIGFESWNVGIDTVTKALKTNYIDRGADTVYRIGPIYSASPTWSVRVARYMNQIENEYINQTSKELALTI